MQSAKEQQNVQDRHACKQTFRFSERASNKTTLLRNNPMEPNRETHESPSVFPYLIKHHANFISCKSSVLLVHMFLIAAVSCGANAVLLAIGVSQVGRPRVAGRKRGCGLVHGQPGLGEVGVGCALACAGGRCPY
jgi:hypothetical protein